MADLELPEQERAKNIKRADTALRVGMICGLAYGIDMEECEKLATLEDGDFRYTKECKAVLELYYLITGRKPK